jgi:hypothetical protein
MRALLIVLIVFLSLNALLNLILAIYSLITDDSDGSWGAPSFLIRRLDYCTHTAALRKDEEL